MGRDLVCADGGPRWRVNCPHCGGEAPDTIDTGSGPLVYPKVGAGLQNRSTKGDTLQFCGEVLTGPNVHGLVLKPQVGASVELSDTLALHAQGGRTIGIGSYGQNSNKQKFRANDLAVGLSYRFSVPSR